jgi:hypothetical protein
MEGVLVPETARLLGHLGTGHAAGQHDVRKQQVNAPLAFQQAKCGRPVMSLDHSIPELPQDFDGIGPCRRFSTKSVKSGCGGRPR